MIWVILYLLAGACTEIAMPIGDRVDRAITLFLWPLILLVFFPGWVDDKLSSSLDEVDRG